MRINVANDEMLGRTTGELKKEIDLHCDFNKYLLREIEKAGKEIERLHSIIKEVREYIINTSYESGDTSSMYLIDVDKLLEILDKENK